MSQDNQQEVTITVPEFNSILTMSFDSPEISSKVVATILNFCYGENESDKENSCANRTFLTAGGLPRSNGHDIDKIISSSALRIKSPTKPSGLTPNKKKNKKCPISPVKMHLTEPPSTQRGDPPGDLMSQDDRDNLSDQQRCVIECCTAGHNVFYSGGAGTGKSYVLRHIVRHLVHLYGSSAVFVTATTGLAACAVGGVTVHQFAGIRPGDTVQMSVESLKQVCCAVIRYGVL